MQDARGLPAEAGQIPDYTALAQATERFARGYARNLARRRRQRRSRLTEIAASPDPARKFGRHASGIRRALLSALGGFPAVGPRPRQ